MKTKLSIIVGKLLAISFMLVLGFPVYGKRQNIENTLLGMVEEIFLFEKKLKFRAKLDTGAKSSSLSATNITEFEFDGKTWVSFRVLDSRKEKYVEKKLPLERYARIKQHLNYNNHTKSAKRPVVLLPICIGNKANLVEVNLVDRSHFRYPVLLGRDTLVQFNVVVDPAKKFTHPPTCESML